MPRRKKPTPTALANAMQWAAAKAKGRPKAATFQIDEENLLVEPTAERRRHDPVERQENQINDHLGNSGQPYRVLNLLLRLEQSGKLTREAMYAAKQFRDDFDRAGLETLRAADLARPFVDGKVYVADVNENARDRVWRALMAVNGLQSIAGSLLYHVIGLDYSLRQWVMHESVVHRRQHNEDGASLALCAMLDALVAHYRPPTKGRIVSRRFS